MSKFTYSATDAEGRIVDGQVNADDMIHAAEQVRVMGYSPTKVQLVAETELADTGWTPPAYEADRVRSLVTGAEAGDTTLWMSSGAGYAGNTTLLSGPQEEEDAEEPDDSYLEPWQRGGPVIPPPQLVGNGTPLEVTQPLAPAAGSPRPPVSADAGRAAAVRPGVEIPYSSRPREASIGQRFVEAFIYPIRSGVVIKDLVPFYRQFATMIGAGLSLYQALAGLESNTGNQKLKEVAAAAQRQVSAGGRISDVMANYPWIFPVMHIEMVRAAEQGGMLEQVLRQIADYVEHELSMRRLISAETFYPKLVLFFALMMLGGSFFSSGTPAVSSLVLGSMGKANYGMSDYFGDTIGFALKIAVPIFALIVVFRLFLYNIKGFRESYDTFKTSVPGLGNIIKMFSMAKFMRTYAALYRGGFSMSTTLHIAGDASGNVLLRNAARQAVPHVERGGLVSDVLDRSGFFPPIALNMFRTGETSGSMDLMLDKVADYFEEEAKVKSRQVALLFSVSVLLLVGMLVGFAVIRFYMGYAGAVSGGGGE